MNNLHPRTQAVLDAIYELTAEGWPATIRDIAEVVGLASTNTVHYHVKTLEKLKLVRRRGDRKAGILPAKKEM